MPLLKQVSNRPALVTFVFALALLMGTACACPGPTTPETLTISPSSATVVAGATKQYCALGSTSRSTWTVDGGTFTVAGTACIIVTAGPTPGTFQITAIGISGQKATATLIVVAQ